jgi:hypothetical protein
MNPKMYIAAVISLGAVLTVAGCSNTTNEATRTTQGGSTTTAPSGEDAKRVDQALVRFINATNTGADLYFGDMPVFTNVGAQSASPYMQVPSERHDFKLFTAGNHTPDPLATNSEGPSAGGHYTIVAERKTNGKDELKVVKDDFTAPAAGKAKIRVVHAADGAPKVDIYPQAGKDAIISGASFGDATNYKEVDPTTTELDIRQFGTKKNEATVKNVMLMADKFYTIVVMGGNGRPLTTKVIEDQLTNQTASTRP